MKRVSWAVAVATAFVFACFLATATPASADSMVPQHGGGYMSPDHQHTSFCSHGDPSSEDFVLGPTMPGKWGPPAFGTGATVTWSFIPTGVSCAAEFVGCVNTAFGAFMPAGFLAAVNAAFAAWAAVADLTFMMVADCGLPFNDPACVGGDIRIGAHTFDGMGGVLAHGFFPPINGTSAAGDIHFDVADMWKIGFGGPGFDIFQVMAHELGHALGLAHTGVPNSLMNAFYTEAFLGPQADDIAGMQFIYGPQNGGVIPEPATLLLLGSGLTGIAYWRRRRQR